ncbi:hypothetical protein QAD02_014269 [Eretmocerus hayati]|uniref:Uncharacterized protein n=1 Tax=Eretmocerus hayati TaxID=131215 RepID=A0ACC2P523_9HYME|nr:hypothetical protein QAD02_014269 [Eretmocerus hayati]
MSFLKSSRNQSCLLFLQPRLGHETGAGAPCLTCSKCAGLDLHFWRKICKICKCRGDEHDFDDDDFPQFELLFGLHLKRGRNRSILLRVNLRKEAEIETPFEWIPPNTSKELAADYMNALPSQKLPIKGSAGAAHRKQQLKKQLPLHDIDFKSCDELSAHEKKEFERYHDNLKKCVGQGAVMKLFALQPFDRSTMGTRTANENLSPFNETATTDSIKGTNLQIPSSFIPQNLYSHVNSDLSNSFDNVSVSDTRVAPSWDGKNTSGNNPQESQYITKDSESRLTSDVQTNPNATISEDSKIKTTTLAAEYEEQLRKNLEFSSRLMTSVPIVSGDAKTSESHSNPTRQRDDKERRGDVDEILNCQLSMNPSQNKVIECQPSTAYSEINTEYLQMAKDDLKVPQVPQNLRKIPCNPYHDNQSTKVPSSPRLPHLYPEVKSSPVLYDVAHSEKLKHGVFPHDAVAISPSFCHQKPPNQLPGNPNNLTTNKRKCFKCREDILFDDVIVTADKIENEVWHPGCFVCSVCNELLVDLVYFAHGANLFCGRDFADLLEIPRCFACDELIFVREYTAAEGHNYHIKHFCCWDCDKALAGLQYVIEDERPLCLACYQTNYAKSCSACGSVVAADQQGVSIKNLNFHANDVCFCCHHCRKSLFGSQVAVKEGKLMCSKECIAKFLQNRV